MTDIVERLRDGVTRTDDGRPVFPIGELADEAITEIETLRADVHEKTELVAILRRDHEQLLNNNDMLHDLWEGNLATIVEQATEIEMLRATVTAATELVTAVHDGTKEYRNRYGDLACLQFAIDLRLRGLK